MEGRATCENDELSELYAVLGDTIVPVSRSLETDEFQVTFSDDHKKMPKGYYTVRFYDDVGYLALRKAQSQGLPLDQVQSVFNVDVYHPVSLTLTVVYQTFLGCLVQPMGPF